MHHDSQKSFWKRECYCMEQSFYTLQPSCILTRQAGGKENKNPLQ